ncbi:107aa long hypothetical protein [Pyrococcus horikoshii OT3]|uniref:Uncharacterized protein n=1 Tax=Pyrococcus horikoshii (strain ATCC 700860 / DSM 12428 / JCM 9974 / NBRC 100139 / OT-3) TaxID=70601 RepID=O58090_PYRHO|nr:107aa long hypothetical protein [Pyrococcus horikoshii OT3]
MTESLSPIIVTGIATKSPAIGPLAPKSTAAFLVGIGDFTLITAPSVPMKEGNGMKYGNVDLTLCKVAAILCPISWVPSIEIIPRENANAFRYTFFIPGRFSSFKVAT